MSTTPAPSLKPLTRGVVVAVAGISQYQDAARATHIGDEVILRHETSNPFDPDAVAIVNPAGHTIGYVPTAGRLNSRLLVGHRGGVWGGVVVDRHDAKETVGLRVKILTLLGHGPAAFGADHPGLRGGCDEPVVDALAVPATDRQPTDEPAAVPLQQQLYVFAPSGRLLGEYLDTAGGKVRVRNSEGGTAAFPAAVVDVRPADVLPATG